MAGCPFFRQRMAVILEAYLLGCGEAMLTEFQRQVQVVKCLHDVALAVKVLYPDKTDLPSTGKFQTTVSSVLLVFYTYIYIIMYVCQLLRSCRSYWKSAIYPPTSWCLLIPVSEQEAS